MKRFYWIPFLLFFILGSIILSGSRAETAVSAQTNDTLYFPIISTPKDNAWVMAGGNNERTSWSPEEITGKLTPAWTRPFAPYISQKVQIIAEGGLLYISTANGLYALNAETGGEAWRYPTELPLGHSPTIYKDVVYVGGFDRKLHAINANNGTGLWTYEAEAGFQTNPVVVNDIVYLGNRDGTFYAIRTNGSLAWKYDVGAPILYSAAYKSGVLYFAAEDGHAYALNANSGALIWQSDKLPGAGFQSWWPVIYGNRVIFSGSNNYRTSVTPGAFTKNGSPAQFSNMEKEEIYPNYQSDPRGTLYGTLTRAGNGGPWVAGTPLIDATKVVNYLNNKPWRQSVFVLNIATGERVETAPVLWAATHSGTRFPPVVGPDGVLYQQNNYMSDRSIAGGQIAGWLPGSNQISVVNSDWGAVDEPHSASFGGNVMYWNLCCDRQAGAIDVSIPNNEFALRYLNVNIEDNLKSRQWSYFGYNLNRMLPDYYFLFHNPDRPNGYSSVYATFAGPINSKNGAYGWHADVNPPVAYNGKVYLHRSNVIMAFDIENTAVTNLPMLTATPTTDSITVQSDAQLKAELADQVQRILDAGHLRPAYTSHGIFDLRATSNCGGNLVDYWHNTGETLYTLSAAYPHLSPTMQTAVRAYMQSEFTNYPPHVYNHNGWAGAPREPFDVPPDARMDQNLAPVEKNFTFQNAGGWNSEGVWGRNPYAWYGLWHYAQIMGGGGSILSASNSAFMDEFNTQPSDTLLLKMPHVHNAYIAGYQGYLGLQQLAGQAASTAVQIELNRLLALRANNFTANSAYVDMGRSEPRAYCRTMAVADNFMYMTPELAAYLRSNALAKVQATVDEYEILAPYWFVSLGTEGFGENAINLLYDAHGLFMAKALILNESDAQMQKYLDVAAFPRGDLYYIQKLVTLIE